MPNGVDLERGRAGVSATASLSADWDLPADAPVYLFLGRMMWYKGLRIILDGLKRLQDAGKDFCMVFVGDGQDRAEVEEYAASLGLQDRCRFVGAVHDREIVRAWYTRADLLLFPSTFDTNGLVVREAAACALPSVLIAGSCAAEDVEDGVSGFLIEENADSMAAKLTVLCREPEAVRAVGENALRTLYLSWEDAVANACRRYGTVIENYRAGLYTKHTSLTADLIHSIAQSLEGYNRSRDYQKAKMQELSDGYRRLYGQLVEGGQKRLTDLQDAQSRVSVDLRAEEEQHTAELMHKFDELTWFLDRFM
jgi:hypothetical protein